jgi:hypothetical protein
MVRNIMFHDAIDRIRNDVKINFAGRVWNVAAHNVTDTVWNDVTHFVTDGKGMIWNMMLQTR